MKITAKSLLSILLFASVACNSYRENASTADPGNPRADSIAYTEMLTRFQKDLSAIETEYEASDADRQIQLALLYEETEQKLLEAQKQFIGEHSASMISLDLLQEIDWSFTRAAEFREYLEKLDNSLHKSPEYRSLLELVNQMELVEPGKQAPDFEMKDTKGNTRKLSEFYDQSEYLLLDFWASTCGPCRKENANIRRAYDLYHPDGFLVVGVSTDIRRDQWTGAIEKDGLIWPNLSSLEPWMENEVVKLYALRQVSQNFLLDGSGKIIATDIKGAELISTLEELFP